jgi:hypothetical protein
LYGSHERIGVVLRLAAEDPVRHHAEDERPEQVLLEVVDVRGRIEPRLVAPSHVSASPTTIAAA